MTTSARELCQVSGLTYRQVDYWVRQGVLEPAADHRAPGSGNDRPFTEEEVRVARVLANLRSMGVPLRTLAEVAEQLRSYDEHQWHGLLFIDGVGLIQRVPAPLCWAIDLDTVLA